jgi:hypothetical protein
MLSVFMLSVTFYLLFMMSFVAPFSIVFNWPSQQTVHQAKKANALAYYELL